MQHLKLAPAGACKAAYGADGAGRTEGNNAAEQLQTRAAAMTASCGDVAESHGANLAL